MLLEQCQDPECPQCGCKDSKIVHSAGRWGGPVLDRRHCNHCHHEWREKKWATPEPAESPNGELEEPSIGETEPGALIYHVLRCPGCQSRNIKVTSSPKPKHDTPRIRYHECKDCKNTFKSVERSAQ